jgi:hypothetical protein
VEAKCFLYNTRCRFLLKEDPHRTNNGMNEPLNIRILDEFSDLFEFGGSRGGFRVRIKERMRQSSCVCCPFLILIFCIGELEDKLC